MMNSITVENRLKLGLLVTGFFTGLLLFSAISLSNRSNPGTAAKQQKKKVREEESSLSANTDSSSLSYSNSYMNENSGISGSNTLVGGLVPSQTNPSTRPARPRAAGGGSRRPILTPESLQFPDIPITTVHENSVAPTGVEAEVWAINESENLLNLIMSIAEEQTLSDTIIHRSVSCNHCGMSPVRGWRYKCANCVDFDLCSGCEALDVHYKTHTFIKIRIPIPPQANPRSMIFQPFYPGTPWINTPSFDTSKLESETHFDSMEIMGFYYQFKSLSTVDSHDGGITKDTFQKCLVTLKRESQMIVDRIFSFFDRDGDGIISFENMVRGLSILCKGTLEERIQYAFEGYDLNGDGVISKDEFRKMFKSYFLLSMELVRGVVKVMEEGMLDNFDDEAEKPVSAAFGAPSTLNDGNTLSSHQERDESEDTQNQSILENEKMNPNLMHTHLQTLSATFTPEDSNSSSRGKPPLPSLTIPDSSDISSNNFHPGTGFKSSPRRPSIDTTSPASRTSIPVMHPDEDHYPIMEFISHEAIEEMVDQVFVLAGIEGSDREFLTFDEFRRVVEQDANVLAWIEALGSVF